MNTGGGLAWLPCRVSCKRTDDVGPGRGIWLGSIFDGPETAFPLGPIAGDIVAIDCWLGRGGGMPYILGG